MAYTAIPQTGDHHATPSEFLNVANMPQKGRLRLENVAMLTDILRLLAFLFVGHLFGRTCRTY